MRQAFEVTLISLSTIPHRLGSSLVIVVGIAGVVGVLVSVMAMAEGFRHTLASTGRNDRVIMLRAGSDAEMSSGVDRDQSVLLATLPGVARGADGRPLASAELVVMVDVPRKGETSSNNVPFRGVQPAAFEIRDELRLVDGRRFTRGVREVIVGRKAAQQFAGLTVGARMAFRDSDWTVVGIFESGGDVHESEILADAEVALSAFRRTGFQSVTAKLVDGSTRASPRSRTRSGATRASRSTCCASPSTTRSRRRCWRRSSTSWATRCRRSWRSAPRSARSTACTRRSRAGRPRSPRCAPSGSAACRW
jgi:putative ABC transport system permease protein